jgi:hypothetical protein
MTHHALCTGTSADIAHANKQYFQGINSNVSKADKYRKMNNS